MAVTLICQSETWFSGELVKLLESNEIPVPSALRKLAFKNFKFRKSYFGSQDSHQSKKRKIGSRSGPSGSSNSGGGNGKKKLIKHGLGFHAE